MGLEEGERKGGREAMAPASFLSVCLCVYLRQPVFFKSKDSFFKFYLLCI